MSTSPFRLTGVGFLGGKCPARRAPRREWTRDSLNQIIGYLEGGQHCYHYLQRWITCEFGCDERKCPGVTRFLTHKGYTDGRWVWPVQLIHAVAFHNVDLPKEFLRTMMQNGWRVPNGLPDFFGARPDIDHTFWEEWFRRHRRPWYVWW